MSITDRRRRLGPSTAIPLYFPSIQDDTIIKDGELELKEKHETVKNNKLFIQMSNIPTATGSSFLQSGNNLILASVYGPRPSFKRTFNSKAVLKINFHTSPFLSSRITNNNNNTNLQSNIEPKYQIIDSVISSTLETACANLILLDQYPKSTIDIFVNLINTDNSTTFIQLLALIHNAVNIALVDSGIAIKNFPTAVVSNENIFINSIHSNIYNSDQNLDIQNEELLTFYIQKLESDNGDDIQASFNNAITDARLLRGELSQFCYNKL